MENITQYIQLLLILCFFEWMAYLDSKNNKMTIQGKVLAVKEKQDITATFSKREIWLETEGKYPQTVCLEFSNDKCALLDDVAIGEYVAVEFEVRGRQHKDRVYNTLAAWKITVHPVADESRMVKQGTMSRPAHILDGPADDLPF